MSLICAVLLIGANQSAPSIENYVQDDLKSLSFVARVIKANQKELRKINETFGQSYKFDTTAVFYKDPFKLRLEANVEDTSILYILKGDTQVIKVPRAGISTHQNLAHAPGRRQTLLDFGLLASSLFKDLFSATYVRKDRETGAQVFDIRYQGNDDASRSRIWVDPVRRIIVKREWFNQADVQLATFFYSRPEKVNGIYVPTMLTVRNTDNVIAGVTEYNRLQVNADVSESLFSTSN